MMRGGWLEHLAARVVAPCRIMHPIIVMDIIEVLAMKIRRWAHGGHFVFIFVGWDEHGAPRMGVEHGVPGVSKEYLIWGEPGVPRMGVACSS